MDRTSLIFEFFEINYKNFEINILKIFNQRKIKYLAQNEQKEK
jgi:hypothetical protein